MPELPLVNFIPCRRIDVVAVCGAGLTGDRVRIETFSRAWGKIEHYFQRDFHQIKQQLKDVYAPLDPDADTRMLKSLPVQESPITCCSKVSGLRRRQN